MMMAFLFFTFLILFLVLSSIKIAKENEKLVHFRLGRRISIADPGLRIVLPIIDRAVKIRIGDRGEILSPDLIIVNGIEFQCTSSEALVSGTTIRIIGFIGNGNSSVARVVATN